MKRLNVSEHDIEEVFIRSSGSGGQNVNKVATCVQIRHIPTGLTVKCQAHRSQGLNRFEARALLLDKIEAQQKEIRRRLREEIEKERRRKRRRSAQGKERMLEEKRRRSQKKGERKKLDLRTWKE